jgi:hypothetical protein
MDWMETHPVFFWVKMDYVDLKSQDGSHYPQSSNLVVARSTRAGGTRFLWNPQRLKKS